MGDVVHWKAKKPIITEEADPDLHKRIDKLWSEVAGYEKMDACLCLIQAISVFLRLWPDDQRDGAHQLLIKHLRGNLGRYKRFSG